MFTALTHTNKTLPYVHDSGTDNIVCFIAFSQKCSQSCVHSSDTHNTLSCVHSSDTDNTLACVDSSDTDNTKSSAHSSGTENKGCSRNVRCSNNWHRQRTVFHGTLTEMFIVLCSQLRLTQTTHGCPWHTGRNVHSPVFTAQIETDSKGLSMVCIQNCSQQTMEQKKVETAGKKKKRISHQRQPKVGRPKRSRACTEAEKKEKREK